MDWKLFVTDPKTKRPYRGAISRISIRLGLHFGTVKKMYDGETFPTVEESRKLQNLVHSRTLLAPKKRKDAGKKRGKYLSRKAVSHR